MTDLMPEIVSPTVSAPMNKTREEVSGGDPQTVAIYTSFR
jgi:hypothetical protein